MGFGGPIVHPAGMLVIGATAGMVAMDGAEPIPHSGMGVMVGIAGIVVMTGKPPVERRGWSIEEGMVPAG